jgi:hypothetical protein
LREKVLFFIRQGKVFFEKQGIQELSAVQLPRRHITLLIQLEVVIKLSNGVEHEALLVGTQMHFTASCIL